METVGRRSLREGRPWSRLPYMDDATKAFIKGKADYFGLNYYTSNFAHPRTPNTGVSHWDDQEVNLGDDASWPVAKSPWLKSVPEGLRAMLKYGL